MSEWWVECTECGNMKDEKDMWIGKCGRVFCDEECESNFWANMADNLVDEERERHLEEWLG